MNVLKPAEITIITLPTTVVKPDIVADNGMCGGCNCGVLNPGAVVINPASK